MAKNAFLLDSDQYKRHITPITDYLQQTAKHASLVLNKPYDACYRHLCEKLKKRELPFSDPTVVFFHRNENGDRFKQTMPLSRYLSRSIKENNILVPTGTTYLHPSVKESNIVGFLDMNVKKRSEFKKKAQRYEFEGKIDLYQWNNNAQDNKKRANNSVSGGFVAGGSIIQNRSAHSTLTSTIRSISSLSNASNERVIAGNRHYFHPDIVRNNIISIITNSDFQKIDHAMQCYGLVYPSVQETVACFKRSTDLYFQDTRKIAELTALVETLTPVERAAFVYTGDLYNLRILNEGFIRNFISELSAKGRPEPVDEVRKQIWTFDEQIINYAHQVCLSIMRGKGKDYDEIPDADMFTLYRTCQNIQNTVNKYKPLLDAFFLTPNHPATIATIPNMIRRSVVLSDTDSTMFSADEWVQWFFNDVPFTDEGYAVGGAIMYVATQAIAHILAYFSANMNVEAKRLHTLAMKPEYVFPVFAQTSVAKHYYTAMAVKEGNVYKDIKMEVKGVHMKDSTVPKNIIKGAHDEMERIIRAIMAGEKLQLSTTLNKAIDIEKDILSSILMGETKYLKRIRIKDKSAYKNAAKEGEVDKTNYRHYTCWQRCFARLYGNVEPPPYQAVSIPLDLPNKTAVTLWLDKLEDKTFVADFRAFMLEHNMNTIGQIHIPMDYCRNHGVPPELAPIVDASRIALTLTRSYRNTVESLGLFSKPDMLLMDQVV